MWFTSTLHFKSSEALDFAVFKEDIKTEDQLWQCIQNAAIEIHHKSGSSFHCVRSSFLCCLNACIESNCSHFEYPSVVKSLVLSFIGLNFLLYDV